MVLTAGCHYSRSEGRQQDRRKKETANKKEGSREVAGEGRDEGPEEKQVKQGEGEKEKRKVTS